jgi:hypothetical protein
MLMCLFSLYTIKTNQNCKKIKQIETFIQEEEEVSIAKKNSYPPFDPINLKIHDGTFSHSCCPSTYSTDRGCLCVNKEQNELFLTRGMNRTGKNYTKLYEEI